MATYLPHLFNWLMDKALRYMSAKAFPDVPESWRFSPAPSVAVTPPLIAHELYTLMKSGFAEPVAAVAHVTGPKSVLLTDGRALDDIDAIIYCTGYEWAVPFLPPEFNPYRVVGEPAELFHGTFPLHADPSVRNSLAFLGHGAVTFPGFVQHELLSMAVSQTWLGNSPLPPLAEMKTWHDGFLAWRRDVASRQKIDSTFYVGFLPFGDHMNWLDKTAGSGVFERFGWFNWKSWQFWWRERGFKSNILTGLLSPAIWRYFETGKRKAWVGAKEQILKDNEAAVKQKERYKKQIELNRDVKKKI